MSGCIGRHKLPVGRVERTIKSLTPTMRYVLRKMYGGWRLSGSSIGQAKLVDDLGCYSPVHVRTHEGLIRRGLVERIKGTGHGLVSDWTLTPKAIDLIERGEATR